MRKKFCGWYFKCRSDTKTLAVIFAFHGEESSIQLICDEGSWSFDGIPEGNLFGRDGIELNLHGDGIDIEGSLKFSELTPIKYDIMGPFALVPFMQCRHSIVSMRHRVNGEIMINGAKFIFENALGYIEGDQGSSFPRQYIWTQSFFDEGSLMLSAADIPIGKFSFTGIICVILLRGREYRLATYLGAKVSKLTDNEIEIRQGAYTFTAKLLEKNERPLKAPLMSEMLRTIHESPACKAYYRFEKDGRTLLLFETDTASFEYEYGAKQ